jgi:hypothetical protein
MRLDLAAEYYHGIFSHTCISSEFIDIRALRQARKQKWLGRTTVMQQEHPFSIEIASQ